MIYKELLNISRSKNFDNIRMPMDDLIRYIDRTRYTMSFSSKKSLMYWVTNDDKECKIIFENLILSEEQLKIFGKKNPKSYIIIFEDKSNCVAKIEIGVSIQAILTALAEDNLCWELFGSFNIKEIFALSNPPENFVPSIIIAIGKQLPIKNEKSIQTEVDQKINFALKDILINEQ